MAPVKRFLLGWRLNGAAALLCACCTACYVVAEPAAAEALWTKIEPYAKPPEEFAGEPGAYRSPLSFADGSVAKSPADWARRRDEIAKSWHKRLGSWPPLVERPAVKKLSTVERDGFVEHKVQVQASPDGKWVDGYLLIPRGKGPFPAVVVPFYEPLTSIGRGAKGRGMGTHDYGLQLVKRGFVTLSIGTPGSLDNLGNDTRDALVKAGADQRRQPLTLLAYVAANCLTALAQMPEVDAARIGIIGLSYGGKWSMFASCLDERFACAVWSDPGIVFNEKDSNVNYWEPWYLGFDPNVRRKEGVPSPANPRTGLYKEMIDAGDDLVDLHALMAPRPVLVSGGVQDPPKNWQALNHLVAVNDLLGRKNRVFLTARKTHVPTAEALELEIAFLEYFLKYAKEDAPKKQKAAQGVTPIPEEVVKKFKLDTTFYEKHLDYKGFSILSSAKVSDAALYEARFLIDRLLGEREDILKAMIQAGCRFMVMAPTEMTTDVPEQRRLKSDPKTDWDKRARGLGGKLSSCGEENLLNLKGDRYKQENILIHEFNHAIHQQGLRSVDPTFNSRLKKAYDSAKAAGLWKGTYVIENPAEYWAEGAQAYFDCMRPQFGANTREKLAAYDPELFRLVDEVYKQSKFRYVRYDQRTKDSAATAGHSADGQKGMVVSVSRPASEVGVEILRRGGNAVDASIAVAFVLAVTWPEAGNIGGGGFMMVHPGAAGVPAVFDYRETAPASATAAMFSKGIGTEHRMVGVPGTVRGMELAHKRFGKLPWKDLVEPAVRLADDGFVVNEALARSLNAVLKRPGGTEEFRRVFAKNEGAWQTGDRLVQKDLAATLRRIADEGPDAFYAGKLAEMFEAEMKRGGGLISQADLKAYQAKERTPVLGEYRGYQIYAPPPPSSGGMCLIEMLNIAGRFELRLEDRWSPKTAHVMVEAMRQAFYDRARHLGDPDFVKIPSYLLSKEYAANIADKIDLRRARKSDVVGKEILTAEDGAETTHFSVIDQNGMAVSNTYTLEQSFGARIVVPGTGFLLNNEMGDFNPKPGVTDRKGRIGTLPNQAGPGKRMLSSMTPVIVAKDGRVRLITGSPGGRTIINTVFCILVNTLEYQMPLRDAIDAPRFHHAWMPDKLVVEKEIFSKHSSLVKRLREMGHTIEETGAQGDAHSLEVSPKSGQYHGVADRRRDGWAAGY